MSCARVGVIYGNIEGKVVRQDKTGYTTAGHYIGQAKWGVPTYRDLDLHGEEQDKSPRRASSILLK